MDEDDEFHDALDSVDEDSQKLDDVLREPAGRLEMFGAEKLLKYTERAIYVPITQVGIDKWRSRTAILFHGFTCIDCISGPRTDDGGGKPLS